MLAQRNGTPLVPSQLRMVRVAFVSGALTTALLCERQLPPVNTQPASQFTVGETDSADDVVDVAAVNTRLCAVREPQELVGW